MGYSLFAYSHFAYSHFAYFRRKCGVSPTRKKQLYVNVLNINELLNIQYNNNTTLLQYLDISVCRYSLYISGGFKGGFKFLISASGFQGSLRRACSSFRLYNEQLSCCLLVLDHFYCTNTSLTCTGRYTQLQLLVQTKP